MSTVKRPEFTQLLPHLGAAYNLARWLTRNEADAEDSVQEAYLRAFKHFESFRGGDGRAWLLTIVRNSCYDRLKKNGVPDQSVFDEEIHSINQATVDPETTLLKEESSELMRAVLEELAPELREAFVLRELEEMSYKQIANITSVRVGTVMSRLSRARQRLRHGLRVKMEQRPIFSPA